MVKHQKVSKDDENDFLEKFILILTSLLKAPVVKNSHIYDSI